MNTLPPSLASDDPVAADPAAAAADLAGTAAARPEAGTGSDALTGSDAPLSPAPLDPPEPPEEILRAAKLAPDHWFSTVDPGWRGEGVPPDYAVAGRWRSDGDGEIVEWEENDAYLPSPEVLGWPEPTDPVDEALQRAVTGYGPPEDVAHALVDAEVAVLTLPDGSPVTATGSDGTPVVPVFTSSRYLNLVGALAFDHRAAAGLLPELPDGHRLYVNPPSPAGAVLETGPLAEMMALIRDSRPRQDPSQETGTKPGAA
ncbi:type VII secretion system-associated protein [Streptomyces scopuliridis]|uniref:type VII secretion system-associated protein n=1 Tax=Streptomyces scopuliridis TaxID=452529 RepID=UPI00369E5A56